jgi:hypothetical protein
MSAVAAVTRGLFVRIEAKEGKEDDVERLLRGAVTLVNEEMDTTSWFAVKFGPATFGIFDVFPSEEGRNAHLSGKVAQALTENAGILYDPPNIEEIDILAAKLPQ